MRSRSEISPGRRVHGMDAHAPEAAEHELALAHAARPPPRRGTGRPDRAGARAPAARAGVAQRDEQHEVAAREPREASSISSAAIVSTKSVNTTTSERRVRREREVGQAQGEVRLGRRVAAGRPCPSAASRRRSGAPPALARPAGARRRRRGPRGRPALSARPGEQQRGLDRVVQTRRARERLRHQVPGVEGQHHAVVALGPALEAQQPTVARRGAPARSPAGPCPASTPGAAWNSLPSPRFRSTFTPRWSRASRRTAAPAVARGARWAPRAPRSPPAASARVA